MVHMPVRALGIACAIGLAAGLLGTTGPASAREPGHASHVLLLSVDGLHQSDLAWYIEQHPSSALANLVSKGVEFTRAQTPVPSDSFPGLLGQVTGGTPSSTGIFYDDSYDSALLPAGTTSCTGVAPGAEVNYTEQADRNVRALDAGQELAGLPDTILGMTGHPQTLIDPSKLPVDPATCKPVYPHSYLKVNTAFEVARAAGLGTAWADKHPAYEILNGPSGSGVQDLFTPEIASDAPSPGSGQDWTRNNALTQRYDTFKVAAVINEINGFDHAGTTRVGTPAIFGMNFQSVSTAQKLPISSGLRGGYLADGVTPGPLLTRALDYINAQVAGMTRAIAARHLEGSTAIILSAKHGQSPQTPSALTRIPDGPIVDALNAAWKAANPAATAPLVAQTTDDDAMLMWLTDRSEAATEFASDFLLNYSGTGNDINGDPKPYTHAGLARIYAGEAAAEYFHVEPGDSRVPDLFGVVQYGVVFTGGKSKIAEHGGALPQDRDVPLVVSGGSVGHHGVENERVVTTQIAPTILQLLGLDPEALKAVRIEHTRGLLSES